MSTNIEPNEKQIQSLRSAFLKELEIKGGDGIIHPADLARIKSGDDWLRRFLLHFDLGEKEALSMLWDTVNWRRDFKTNEITVNNINLDFIKEGVYFARGRDKDGSKLFIFKFKKYIKGRDFEETKRCIIYWLERLEKEENGKPVTIFFDMDGCGVSNVDMELTKYIIHVFKQYYPFFLNYIIILEMAWILNAVFKVIKAMLPEKAVEKIKFVKKSDLNQFVEPDQALTSWGGNDNYAFVFEPEIEETVPVSNTNNNKKVHFADGSLMSETAAGFNDKEQGDGILKVYPPGVINFVKEGTELISTLELHNTDNQIIVSYKMKTTSPEKFRVRPSAGCLVPGERTTISVTLLPGFQLGGLSRDKFLVMSMTVESADLSAQDLTELWKNPAGKNISQHRLRCAQGDDITRNGVLVSSATTENDHNQILQLTNKITQLSLCQSELHVAVKRIQHLQKTTMILVVMLMILIAWALKQLLQNNGNQFCTKPAFHEPS